MTAPRTRTSCPSCGLAALTEVLRWPSIPVNAALFPTSVDESLAIPRASFRLVVCEACGLLFNADHDEALVEYSPRCVETQACSPTSRAFTDSLARDWVERHELAGSDVVEVGCGPDAAFLRTMCELTGGAGIGVDPACVPTEQRGFRLIAERFDRRHSGLPGGALVCRHTLEHVSEVGIFLESIREWAARHSAAPLLFEVPDASRILRDGAFWDVYYEHCTYFTASTLESAFRHAGLRPTRTQSAFDGQYLVAEARLGEEPTVRDEARAEVAAAVSFGELTADRVERAGRALRELAGEGPLLLWQAGGKALALLTLADADDAVAGVVDANPAKRGLYMPGTARCILGPADVAAQSPRNIVVMNPVYTDEVAASLAREGVTTRVRPLEALLDDL